MAFAGKTQYLAVLNAGQAKANVYKTVPSGRQSVLPQVSSQAQR